MQHILFVCTGNTCRSPLAEGMLRMMALEENINVEVRSAGVHAVNGAPISSNSSAILQESGFLETMCSSALTDEHVNWADIILTMTVSHKGMVIGRFPHIVDKVHTLKEFVEDDPEVLAAIQERERLAADLQLKYALSQSVTSEERSRISLLDKTIPDYDITDPYGGSLDVYRVTADEIKQCLRKLLFKLKSGNNRE